MTTSWDEIRTAFQVARLGTVSGAAEALGVHHATVIRHIDSLEAQLGTKLFQRHARGYTPTEAGRDLLSAAQEADDRFGQLLGRIKGQGEGVGGEVVVTSLPALAPISPPVLAEFQVRHPSVTVRFLTADGSSASNTAKRMWRFRAGVQPPLAARQRGAALHPDADAPRGLRDLPRPHGMPEARRTSPATASWAATTKAGGRPTTAGSRPSPPATARPSAWPTTEPCSDAILAGAGLGFVAVMDSRRHPTLREVIPPREDGPCPTGSSPMWTCTARPRSRPSSPSSRRSAKAWDA
jgi:DNA-binding transcriptional LysR family regulator